MTKKIIADYCTLGYQDVWIEQYLNNLAKLALQSKSEYIQLEEADLEVLQSIPDRCRLPFNF
jgi:hypothetical protein